MKDTGGLTDTGTVSFEITGTADKFTGSTDTYTFTKTGDAGSFSTSFAVPDSADGHLTTATASVHVVADMDGKNETLAVDFEGGVLNEVSLAGVLNSNGTNESSQTKYLDKSFDATVSIAASASDDGAVLVTGAFSGPVANGSTVSVDIDYAYWA